MVPGWSIGTSFPVPDTTVHELILRHADTDPENPAVEARGVVLNFAELARRVHFSMPPTIDCSPAPGNFPGGL